MKFLIILGGGTAGTIIANKLGRALPRDWRIVVIDRDNDHVYQPGLPFVPFHAYETADLVRSRRHYLERRVELIESPIARIEPGRKSVLLGNDDALPYDFLVVATGAQMAPERDFGLLGSDWNGNVGEFYTLEGSARLQQFLDSWRGGRLVVSAGRAPLKSPNASLEFTLLADAYFRALRIRNGVEIEYVTPLPAAAVPPKVAALFAEFFAQRRIKLTANFVQARVDQAARKIVAVDGRETSYDLLVSTPTTIGAPVVGASGLGNDLNLIATDRDTLLVKGCDNIFALGDATDLPVAKTAATAWLQADVVAANLLSLAAGRAPEAKFSGRASCFVDSGDGKAVLMECDDDAETVPGGYPIPAIGPLSTLKETRLNHWGKMMFRWVYWNLLLPGRPLPVSGQPHAHTAGPKAA
jgi:sulfide:quinone oxidoreductase